MDRRKFIGLIPAAAAIPFLPKVSEASDWQKSLLGGETITFHQDFSQQSLSQDIDIGMLIAEAKPLYMRTFRGDLDNHIRARYNKWNVWKVLWSFREPLITVMAVKGGFMDLKSPVIHMDYEDSGVYPHYYGAVQAWQKIRKKIDWFDNLSEMERKQFFPNCG